MDFALIFIDDFALNINLKLLDLMVRFVTRKDSMMIFFVFDLGNGLFTFLIAGVDVGAGIVHTPPHFSAEFHGTLLIEAAELVFVVLPLVK